MLKQLKIGVYVTGGIAAYKMPDFIRHLIKLDACVRVAMTPAAQQFTTPYTFEVLTKYPVLTDNHQSYSDPVGHIHLADWLDLAIIVPATASTIGKMANGLADNEVTASLLAVNKQTLWVPAMNEKMWQHPATQRNIAQLHQDGAYVMEPATGFLAEGYEGKGRMPEVAEIVSAVQALAAFPKATPPLDLTGQKVIISAGGTQEAIDPVRYISNRSSGKMGIALAHVAAMAGAQVTLVRTTSTLNQAVMPGIQQIHVDSAQVLYDIMHQEIEGQDIVVMAAAVSDYRVDKVATQKIKKDPQAKDQNPTLNLIQNPDILASLPKDKAYVIGFAAETHNLLEFAKSKLDRKGVAMIVANDVSRQDIGFGADDNKVSLVTKQGVQTLEKMDKYQVAYHILVAAQQHNMNK